ncbi:ribosome biogenesis protein SLX9-domain-containing protein [Lipomyces orientalis]|uniref:Ribosome biogenesis protein SLX9-domain-containing protein n=1 Tax=Lipomyces orientalis TaxID=1233043 RepID=A0ACC3TJG8_9ASCO
MAPRRKSASAVVEARQALRAHSNALKLAAAEATIAKSALHASKSRSLGARTGGGITKSPKKTKAVAKRAGLLKRLKGMTSTEDATVEAPSKKRKGLMAPPSTSAVTRLSSSAEGPKSRSLDDVKIVSKSARRRIARAKKERLAGNGLNDLLDALPSDPNTENSAVDDSMNIDEGTRAQKSQDPMLSESRNKPVSQRTHEKILRQEIDRFGKVIAVKDFRENPFAALRGFIQQRI